MAEPFDVLGNIDPNKGNTTANTSSEFQTVWEKATAEELRHLQNIDDNVEKLLKLGVQMSQSSAYDTVNNIRQEREAAREEQRRRSSAGKRRRWDGEEKEGDRESDRLKKRFKQFNDSVDEAFTEFSDSLEEELLKGLTGAGFGDALKEVQGLWADILGVETKDVAKELSHIAGKKAASAIMGTNLFQKVSGKTQQWSQGYVRNAYESVYRAAYSQQPKDPNDPKQQANWAAWRARIDHNYRIRKDEEARESAKTSNQSAGQAAADIHSTSYQRVNEFINNAGRDGGSFNSATFTVSGNVSITTSAVNLMAQASATDVPSGESVDTTALATVADTAMTVVNADNQSTDLAPMMEDLSLGLGDMGDAIAMFAMSKGMDGSASTAKSDTGKMIASAGADIASKGLSTVISGAATAAGFPIPPQLIEMLLKPLLEAVFGVVLNYLSDAFKPLKEGFDELKQEVGDSFNRVMKSAEANIEHSQRRLTDDVESLIREPFEILKDAAQEVYDAWDGNLRVINGTQGYTKDDLQSLMGAYAARLRSEGLASAIGATDITENLTKVLQAGLSGTIAEEFAYTATKLGAAMPTQDFFSYADTYASIASQAMQAGATQSEAIAKANAELQTFASGLLYASRELTGGFTTGLTDANGIFQQAAQIAQAAKTQNASQIAGVLTSVSAIAGAVAPDLTSGLIDAVYKAAVGGNESSIVALRSLAGINASNTEFLQALAHNPQKVFADMFTRLGNLQTMSQDNYMEVAEALSSTFGVSMDAIARVDFNYLAEAIKNMEVSLDSLDQNMTHLSSGETTTSAEALRMQQINEYMIDEGLAYVLDNEVARSIQEHMWQEQIARELQETTYAIELEGAGLKFLQGIASTVDALLTILNPFRLLSKVGDLLTTNAERHALDADIAQTLLLGRVGTGRATDLYNLTTRNADLNLTKSYIALQGGVSAYGALESLMDFRSTFRGAVDQSELQTGISKGLLAIGQAAASSIFSGERGGGSVYNWGSLSKSAANAIASSNYQSAAGISSGSSLATATNLSATDSAQQAANDRLSKMIQTDYIQANFLDQEKGYEDWEKAVKAAGFADIGAALEQLGLTTEDVKGQFTAMEANQGAQEAGRREAKEEEMWDLVIINLPLMEAYLKAQQEHQERMEAAFNEYTKWTKDTWRDFIENNWEVKWDDLGDDLDTINDTIAAVVSNTELIVQSLGDKDSNVFKEVQKLVDYFVLHNVYNSALGGTEKNPTSWYEEIGKIQRSEKDEASSAIYALADVLTANSTELLDPQVQTNALLAQILKLVEILTTQKASAGGSNTIADTLIGLALGYTSNTA